MAANPPTRQPANAQNPLEGDYLVKTETYTSETPLRRTKHWGTLTTVDDPNAPSVIVLSDKVSDTRNRWGLPDGETAIHQGAMWGTYRDIPARSPRHSLM